MCLKRRVKINKPPHPNKGTRGYSRVATHVAKFYRIQPTRIRFTGRNPSQFIIGHSRMESLSMLDWLPPTVSSLYNISLGLPFIVLNLYATTDVDTNLFEVRCQDHERWFKKILWEVYSSSSPTPWYILPNVYLREYFAVVKSLIFDV